MTRRRTCYLSLLVFIVAFLPRIIYPDFYTVAYDELAAKDTGNMLQYLTSGDFSADNWTNNPNAPPFFQYIYGLIPEVLTGQNPSDPMDLFGARLASALMSSLLITVVFLLGKEGYGVWTGMCASLILCFFPTVLGHDRVAMHDLPSRLLIVTSWLFLLRWQRGSRSLYLWSAAALSGLALAIYYRPGIQSGIVVAGWVVVMSWRETKSLAKVARTVIGFGAISFGTALLFSYLFCPFVWTRPYLILKWFMFSVGMAEGGAVPEFWFGSIRSTPSYYYFVVFLFCTPPLVLLGIASYHVAFARKLFKDPFVLAMSAMFWVALATASAGLRQSTMHYLQIAIPFASIMAAEGLAALGRFLAKKRVAGGMGGMNRIVPVLGVAATIWASVACFPFFMQYFNVLCGGGGQVWQKKLFTQSAYGVAVRPLLTELRKRGQKGSAVACHLGPWPGLFRLQDYIGKDFYLQGHGKADPAGPRYALREGIVRDNLFYRYAPDERIYRKIYDVTAGGLSVGDLWERRPEVDEQILFYDDFSTLQSRFFVVQMDNATLNHFSAGRFYGLQPGRRSLVVWKIPFSVLQGVKQVRIELDLKMSHSTARVLAGYDASKMAAIGGVSGRPQNVMSEKLPVEEGKDLLVAVEWVSQKGWDGKPQSFWDVDCIDSILVGRH